MTAVESLGSVDYGNQTLHIPHLTDPTHHDTRTMTEQDDSLSLDEYLDDRKGAAGVLVQIDPEEGDIKSGICDKTDIAGKTLKNRLDEAKAAGWIRERTIDPDDPGRSDRYELTPKGMFVRHFLDGVGVGEAHDEFMEKRDELDRAIEEARSIVKSGGFRPEAHETKLSAEQIKREYNDVIRNQQEAEGAQSPSEDRQLHDEQSTEPEIIEDMDAKVEEIAGDDVTDDDDDVEVWGDEETEEADEDELFDDNP